MRPFAVAVVLLSALLYVVALSAVLAWTSGLRRRRVADARAARDWYLLAAGLGLLAAPCCHSPSFRPSAGMAA